MTYNLGGFLVLSVLAIAVGLRAANRGGAARFSARLVFLALLARIVGSSMRYEVMQAAYGFVGDSLQYYRVGLEFSRRLWSGDLSVLAPGHWLEAAGAGGGTRFVGNISGLIVSVIGPSLRAEFLVFALLSFAGLYWIAKAFARARSWADCQQYAAIVWLWPSLFFWPSSVGKEAILIFALGLATLGFVGEGGRYKLTPMISGLVILFLLRPHVAMLVGGSLGVTHWLFTIKRMNARHVLEGVAIGVLAVSLAFGAADRLGIRDLDAEGVAEFVEFRSDQTVTGGGSIGATPSGVVAVPMALVNVWMRPFIWEAHNATATMASLELIVFWALMIAWRRRLLAALTLFRRDRLVTYAIVLLTSYTLAIGLTFGNLGIIARQRTPMFAFFLMLPMLATVPVGERRKSSAPSRGTDVSGASVARSSGAS